jgi:hypothetical protein
MAIRVPKKLQNKSIRFYITKEGKPVHKAFNLIEEYYKKDEEGVWRNKETNTIYEVDSKPYSGEVGNYAHDNKEFLKFLDTQDDNENLGCFVIKNRELAEELGLLTSEKLKKIKGEEVTQKNDYEITQEEIDDLEDLEVVNANDVEGLDIPSAEWIVDTMAPEGGLTIAAGKSASYKSITFLHMAHCIAVGVPVFNKYITKKPGPVIYLNEENTWSIFKPMVSMIQKGMRTYVKKDLDFKDLHFLTYQQVSLDVKNRRGRAKLEKAIQETGAKVIIFDSLKRFIDFEENDADNVNRFYSFVVKPLMIKYGVTIILLHHVRKDSHGNFKHKGDKKDLLRGSSDFVNIADSILYFERGITNLQFELYQIKNRLAEEFEPKLIRITADADAGFVFTIEEGEQEKNETGKCIDEIIGYIFREKLEEFKSGTKMEALFKDAGFKRGVYNFARNKIVDAKVLVKMDGKKGTYSVDWNHPALIEMLRQEEEKIQTKLGDVEDDSNN